jgi:two-component system, NarL family, response regulator LiaR
MNMISLLIVDDHPMIREGLRSIFEHMGEIQIVGEAENGYEALKLLKQFKVDIVLTDISMPEMNGIIFLKEVKRLYPFQKVIALTMLGEVQHIRQMVNAGVNGYLLKDCGSRELKKAILEVFNGNNYFSEEVLHILRDPGKNIRQSEARKTALLSARETEVLHLICKQYSNHEIAGILKVSLRTVDSHKRALMEKTGARNNTGLILFANENNLFDDL